MEEVIAIKKTAYELAVDHLIKVKIKALDMWIQRRLEPLSDLGNPEKLIGKKYDDWAEEDYVQLGRIYGENSKVLNNFIAKKEIEKMYALESEVVK